MTDVTELEKKNDQLNEMVSTLEVSKAEVQKKNKALHHLATRDPLTGCLNRRAFNEQFDELFEEPKIDGGELSCIMADIDHFKRVNDNYGHGVGDEVIKLFANILHANTRKEDLVGRYGGEEFCIVLPGVTIDQTMLIADRMRIGIAEASEEKFSTGPHIKTSLGVASIHDNPKDPAELNNKADSALYVAKETGRNKVVRWNIEQG